MTATDPRTTALAAALAKVTRSFWPSGRAKMHVPGEVDEWHRKTAAAILAALPPDWCGHADEIAYQKSVVESLHVGMDNALATIATLRAVEQAARDVWDTCPASYDPADPLVIQHAHALNVLRAALAQAQEPTHD
jgi:broad specificity phosphatase PhoE